MLSSVKISSLLIAQFLVSLLFGKNVLAFSVSTIFFIIAAGYIIYRGGTTRKQTLFCILLSGVLFTIFAVSGAFLSVVNRFFFLTVVCYVAIVVISNYIKKEELIFNCLILVFSPLILFYLPYLLLNGMPNIKIYIVIPFIAIFFFKLFGIRKISMLLGIFFIIIVSYLGYGNYNASFFGRMLDENDDTNLSKISLVDYSNDTFDVESIDDQVIILDFWFTNCGVCYKKFPQLEQLKQRYKTEDIFIASVHIDMREENELNIAHSIRDQYSFATLKTIGYVDSNEWNVDKYPTILVFDKHKKLRYKGDLFTQWYLKYNINKIIEDLR